MGVYESRHRESCLVIEFRPAPVAALCPTGDPNDTLSADLYEWILHYAVTIE